jgi:predicted MFS family arabinose efflux permease
VAEVRTSSQDAARTGAPLWRIVSALGIAQIISWGSLYYSLAVLAAPIKAELGLSEVMIFGAFTLGQLASGFAAPWVGRRIDRLGGRDVLTAGSLLGALALTVVAVAQEIVAFTIGWVLAGFAMSACLYDPAFATLSQVAHDRYRRAVTGLTLFGGFASTVFWPLSHALATEFNWRVALMIFAALHLLVCAPIHRLAIPRHADPMHSSAHAAGHSVPIRDRRFVWLAVSFAAMTFVFSALSAHMIAALATRGFTAAQAVWIGALVGPMQVLARIVEWFFAGRISPLGVGYAACALGLFAMIVLNTAPASIAFGALFALCYGASNGILTIARGTVPGELFGRGGQGALLGALARPSFIAKALAPVLFAVGLSGGVPMSVGTGALAIVSAVAFLSFWQAVQPRTAERQLARSSDTQV